MNTIPQRRRESHQLLGKRDGGRPAGITAAALLPWRDGRICAQHNKSAQTAQTCEIMKLLRSKSLAGSFVYQQDPTEEP